jgi:Ca-activated chloride channel family protein
LLVLLSPLTTSATNQNYASDYPSSGSLSLVDDRGITRDALHLDSDVKIAVSGLIARVKLSQNFQNDSDQWMEGLYQFPLPDNAAVDSLVIAVGERLIIGEIKEKQKAKKIYQAAKKSGRKASLVEQFRPNLFSNSVANIAPYESLTVTIEYQQDISFDRKDGFSLRFPMTFTPRFQPNKSVAVRTVHREIVELEGDLISGHTFEPSSISSTQNDLSRPDVIENGFLLNQHFRTNRDIDINHSEQSQQNGAHQVALSIDLNAGLSLASINSSSHKILKRQLTEQRYQIELNERTTVADSDFILNWKPQPDAEPRAAIFKQTKNEQTYLNILVMPPVFEDESFDQKGLSRELTFVIDTSGSMAGVSIKQAKQALTEGLNTLTPNDWFNLVEFNSTTNTLFNSARPATAANLADAFYYIARLRADGGTQMLPAIKAALRPSTTNAQLKQVIFLTDGAISNESQLFRMIDQKLGERRLFTVGIGSAPNEFFMRKAAQFGRGTFTYIADQRQAKNKMQQLFNRISRPQLTQLSIKWPSNITAETWPKKIPDLYNGQPLWIKSKVSSLPDTINVEGQLRATKWQNDLTLARLTEQTGVATSWARAKITALSNESFFGKITDASRKIITELALEHHLISRYTSLVAVDHTPSRVNQELKAERLANQLPKGSEQIPPTSSNTHPPKFASTSLDLDINLRFWMTLLLLSSIGWLVSRRMESK